MQLLLVGLVSYRALVAVSVISFIAMALVAAANDSLSPDQSAAIFESFISMVEIAIGLAVIGFEVVALIWLFRNRRHFTSRFYIAE